MAEDLTFAIPASITADPSWLLVEEGFNLAREHEIESLFAVSNGYVGTRGSLAEGEVLSSPATFIAGVFDVHSQPESIPELAFAPDWMRLRVTVNGQDLNLNSGEAIMHRRVLDMKQGMLWREWRHRDPAGRITSMRFLRLASLADRHLLLQLIELVPENYTGQVMLESIIERPTPREDVPIDGGPELEPIRATRMLLGIASVTQAVEAVEMRTQGTGIMVAFASATQVRRPTGETLEGELMTDGGWLAERWELEAEIGRRYRLERIVAVYTSRDVLEPAKAASAHVERTASEGIEMVVDNHRRTWESRWRAADVQVDGDPEAQTALRFAAYHLISAANPEDERVSIGARTLSGHAYKGHVFWDAEIYMLPFFAFTHPPSARALLMYRYHTLPAARAKARSFGYRGALYAWESADTGEETTPPLVLTPDGEVIRILSGEQEHHISADVAYGVWQYWQATGDDDFFRRAGAEIMLDTARLWASRGRIEDDGRYHIRQVIGPDEYHESVDDNAFTNGMAQWNLERGFETAQILRARWPEQWKELEERLGFSDEEAEEWRRLAAAMYTGLNPQSGLFEQFQGYFGLEEIDLAAYAGRTVPMDVLLGRERIRKSKVVKQPDVVMLIYLLWDRFTPEVREVNFRYYDPRTGHGSSLSPSIHSAVAARLGDTDLAKRYFEQAAQIDLADNMGNAAGGIHAAAQGGLWQAAIFGFAGLRTQPDGLVLDPHLPADWRSTRFQVEWRGARVPVAVDGVSQSVEIGEVQGAPVAIGLASGSMIELLPGGRYRSRRSNGEWEPWREGTA